MILLGEAHPPEVPRGGVHLGALDRPHLPREAARGHRPHGGVPGAARAAPARGERQGVPLRGLHGVGVGVLERPRVPGRRGGRVVRAGAGARAREQQAVLRGVEAGLGGARVRVQRAGEAGGEGRGRGLRPALRGRRGEVLRVHRQRVHGR